ncbi:MAG: lysozyme inhibitor LprI family protein [Paracoccaceae bacterium]
MKKPLFSTLSAAMLTLAAPLPLSAEGHEVEAYSAPLLECFEAAKSTTARAACKGVMSTACMEREEAGYSTYGMVRCTAAETEIWDAFLNTAYQAQMQHMRAQDTLEAETFPEFAKRSEALRDAQRAWIAFRDGECGLAYAMWGSGSMRQIAGASCVMEMTADRALTLESLGEEMR